MEKTPPDAPLAPQDPDILRRPKLAHPALLFLLLLIPLALAVYGAFFQGTTEAPTVTAEEAPPRAPDVPEVHESGMTGQRSENYDGDRGGGSH
jgi:hypothetical protein